MGAEEQILLNNILTELKRLSNALDEEDNVIATETLFDSVIHGHITDHEYGTRVGTNSVIPTSFILLSNTASAATPFSVPASERQLQVVSDSASDSSNGTGAQQVTIDYFDSPDSGWTKRRETLTLNGTTAVKTVATNIYRIDRFWVNRTGTGRFPVGTVSLKSTDGLNTYEKIDPGQNTSRSAVHFIEKGFNCQITDFNIGVSTNQGITFVLVGTEEDTDGNTVTMGKDQVDLNSGGFHAAYNSPIVVSNPNGKEMAFAIFVKGKAINQEASGSFRYVDHPIHS